jgi:hypothetical protein
MKGTNYSKIYQPTKGMPSFPWWPVDCDILRLEPSRLATLVLCEALGT